MGRIPTTGTVPKSGRGSRTGRAGQVGRSMAFRGPLTLQHRHILYTTQRSQCLVPWSSRVITRLTVGVGKSTVVSVNTMSGQVVPADLPLSTHHDTAANHTPSDRIVILMAAGFERTDRLLRKQAVLLLLHSAPAIVLCGCMRWRGQWTGRFNDRGS